MGPHALTRNPPPPLVPARAGEGGLESRVKTMFPLGKTMFPLRGIMFPLAESMFPLAENMFPLRETVFPRRFSEHVCSGPERFLVFGTCLLGARTTCGRVAFILLHKIRKNFVKFTHHAEWGPTFFSGFSVIF